MTIDREDWSMVGSSYFECKGFASDTGAGTKWLAYMFSDCYDSFKDEIDRSIERSHCFQLCMHSHRMEMLPISVSWI